MFYFDNIFHQLQFSNYIYYNIKEGYEPVLYFHMHNDM